MNLTITNADHVTVNQGADDGALEELTILRRDKTDLVDQLNQLQNDHQALGEHVDELAANDSLLRAARFAVTSGLGERPAYEVEGNKIKSGGLEIDIYTGQPETSEEVAHAIANALNLVMGY